MEVTLQSVQKQFTQWRQHKAYRGERIPDHLWELALSLIPHHTQTTIIKTLQLNNGAFRRRLKEAAKSNQLTSQIPHFVELQGVMNPFPSCSSLPCHQIELERPDGCRLRLFSSSEQPINGTEVIHEFLKGNHASGCCAN
jgi:hypothetical protein